MLSQQPPDLTAEDGPFLAVEIGQITFREGSLVVRAGVVGDTRHLKGQFDTFQISGLRRDILAREIVPAWLEQFDQHTRDCVGICGLQVAQFDARRIFKFSVFYDGGFVC
jgi:hypothetical protein